MKLKTDRKKDLSMIFAALIVALVYIICVIYIYQSLNVSEADSGESSRRQVAVIVKSTDSAFWKSVFSGAGAAATEYNLSVTTQGPENEDDYETQNEMIRQAVQDGAEAIIFSAVDFYANADTIDEAAAAGVKIIVIDSTVNSEHISCSISTDNYKAGQMAAQAILNAAEGSLKLGIVNFDRNSANGQQREKGLRDVLGTQPRVEIMDAINVKSTTEDAKRGTEKMLERHPEINAIATFNEWTSLGVGYAIRELGIGEETTVVAFDSNVVSVGMLETGEVDALIVQNPYAIGYLGVEHAYRLINGLSVAEKDVDTATTIITKENMYEEESQKVLFPVD